MAKALGMIETMGLATSIEVTDTMLKNADVQLVKQEMVNAALVTILVEGDVSAVQAAVEAGTVVAKRTGALISVNVIPHPDRELRLLVDLKEEGVKQKRSSNKTKTPPAKRNVQKTNSTSEKLEKEVIEKQNTQENTETKEE